MRKVPYLLILLLFGSCYDQVDGFFPLSEASKGKIPSSYTVGDTLVFIYSDSMGLDTLAMEVQPYKDYLVQKGLLMEEHSHYYQILEQELKPLDGSASLTLVFGTGYLSEESESEKFYFAFKRSKYYFYHLTSIKSSLDTLIYPFTLVSHGYNGPDSVFVSYSTYTGIQKIQNINEGYELKRIR